MMEDSVIPTAITNGTSFVSDPYMQEALQLHCSFGYDCQKYFNLAIIDETLIFSSGNFMHLLNTNDGSMSYKPSIGGNGIGHITTNLRHLQVAVGEKGIWPDVVIYSWPSFNIITQLKKGTERAYVYLDYSSDGEILCSQGSEPDVSLILWNWRQSAILVKCLNVSQTIYKAAFSRLQDDVLITSGVGHISVWRIAKTFTGLKLTGECGQFGATDTSTIIGFECLEDAKVASGCDWGNILVWRNSAIEYEIITRRNQACHKAPVFSFDKYNDWLVSIGTDGWVRVWDLQDNSDNQNAHGRVFQKQEAILYFSIGNHTRLMAKTHLPSDSSVWFLQDGNGAIWRAEVGATLRGEAACPDVTLVFRSHVTGVIAVKACPWATYLATLGTDGRLIVYNYEQRGTFLIKEFNFASYVVDWLRNVKDECSPNDGDKIIIGFLNGVVSICQLSWSSSRISEVQAWRPHSDIVTCLRVHSSQRTFVSASKDANVFVFRSIHSGFRPCGYLKTAAPIMTIQWNEHTKEEILLVCCENQTIHEYKIPENAYPPSTSSYDLKLSPTKYFDLNTIQRSETFLSIKNQALEESNEFQEAIRVITMQTRARELILLMENFADHPTTIIINLDTNTLSGDPCPLLCPKDDVFKSTVTSATFMNNNVIICGFRSGEIQVNKNNSNIWNNSYIRMPAHDSGQGCKVTGLDTSYDQRYLFSCGEDGNVFIFQIKIPNTSCEETLLVALSSRNAETQREVKAKCTSLKKRKSSKNLTMTLEEIRKAKDNKKKGADIKHKKLIMLRKIDTLKMTYIEILARQNLVPEHERTDHFATELHPDITAYLEHEVNELRLNMESEMEPQVRYCQTVWSRVIEHFVQPLHSDSLAVFAFRDKKLSVNTYRLQKLTPDAKDNLILMQAKVDEEIAQSSLNSNLVKSSVLIEPPTPAKRGITPDVQRDEFDHQNVSQVGKRILQRQHQRRLQFQQLEQVIAERPPKRISPETWEGPVREAEMNMGDYKLKSVDAQPECVTLLQTEYQLAAVKLKVFHLKNEHNIEIFRLKAKKKVLVKKWEEFVRTNKDESDLNEIIKIQNEELDENDLLTLSGDGEGSMKNIIYDNECYEHVTR